MVDIRIKNCVVKGLHASNFMVQPGDNYECREDPNQYDQNCIGVFNFNTLVGHAPYQLSVALTTALQNGATVFCLVKGIPRNSTFPWPEIWQQHGGLIADCEYIIPLASGDLHKLQITLDSLDETINNILPWCQVCLEFL